MALIDPSAHPEASRPQAIRPRAPSILFLTRKLDVGGAQRQLVELATGLHGAGWRVTVATFYSGGSLAALLRAAGIEPVSLDKRGRWDVAAFALRLRRLIRAVRPDIVHGYLETSNVLLTLLQPFCGPVRLVWGVRASNMELSHYDQLAAFESRIARRLARRADLIICNSEAGKSYHAAGGYPAERMVVIPNGVDLRRFAPDAEGRAALRSEWGIAPEHVLVGLVGRLDPMKGHREFLRAASRLAASRPGLKFVCVGDGPPPYREALRQESETMGLAGSLTWAGARTDMSRVYNALDVAVSASTYGEGFPNAVVEAMATGIPCVVTDVGDSATIVGGLGRVCAPRDSDALTEGIAQVVAALPADARKIREHIAQRYSSAILLERTMAELAPLAGRHGGVEHASLKRL